MPNSQRFQLFGATCVSALVACNTLSGANQLSVGTDTTASEQGKPDVMTAFVLDPTDAAALPPTPTDDAHTPASVDAGEARLRVFVTSTTTTGGAIEGVAKADALCNEFAQAAGHTGTFVAWLSGDSSPALARLTSAGPWYRYDDVLAVGSRTELTSGTITAPINVDEKLAENIADGVWTGANASGELRGTCFDWNVGRCVGVCVGMQGFSNETSSNWSGATSSSCLDKRLRLYCFQN